MAPLRSEDGHFLEAGFLGCLQSHVPAQDDVVLIDDDGAGFEHLRELLERLDQLAEFLLRDGARVVRVLLDGVYVYFQNSFGCLLGSW